MRRHHGFGLPEFLVVLAIIGIIALVAVPAFTRLRGRSAVRAAAMSMRTIFHLARSRAIARGTNCGVKFLQSGPEWTYAIYDDGDGDGVRNDDITRGTDRVFAPPRVVLPQSTAVSIGLPRQTILDPDGDRLPPTRSPVHFNRSTICSFSPFGEATPGTIYLTSRGGDLFVVRVFGATAKMRVLRYDSGSRKWVP